MGEENHCHNAIEHQKDLLPEPMEFLKTTLIGEQMVRPTERMVGVLDQRDLSPVADVPV